MNVTNINLIKNITDPTDIVYNLNTASNSILGITIIFVVYIILFLTVYNSSQDLKMAYNSSTYITTLFSFAD